MKLNMDCVRDVLISTEEIPYSEKKDISYFLEKLSHKYNETDIKYTVEILAKNNFLEIRNVPTFNNTIPFLVLSLSWEGHSFLENIRSENNWKKVKSIAMKVGTFSVDFLKQTAIEVVSRSLSNYLG